MSKKVLKPEEFGDKLYKTLPPLYHVADEDVKYALKRYLSALSDGGFAKVIEEINGFLTLIDPDKVKEELLPILFLHYGFEVFNGIPTMYLRKLLPLVSDLYNIKGSITAVEYLTSLVSGVKSSVSLDEEFSENHTINVNLEMNYGDNIVDIPDQDQLFRIIKEFVPFYCDVLIVYVYIFEELGRVHMSDLEETMLIRETTKEVLDILAEEYESAVKVIYDALKDTAVLIDKGKYEDSIFSDSLTNKSYNQTEDGHFFYTNAIHSYDIIRTKGVKKAEFNFITND